MKEKLLFVIESLGAAGAERSLVSLLSALDYTRFDVDIQLFRYGGELECFLPKEVNLMPPFEYATFAEKKIREHPRSLNIRSCFARARFSISIRLGKNRSADIARKYWRAVSSCIPPREEHYSAAIAYSQGIPTFYVADKVQANKKIAWVNAIYMLSARNKVFQHDFYSCFQQIVCVSEPGKKAFVQLFPDQEKKVSVIRDRIDPELIRQLAEERQELITSGSPVLLTVARLAAIKGYDILLEACRILRDRGIEFRWYAIGRGPLRQEMEKFIQENKLQNHFFFLGTFANPYPYFKAATIYVQTSRNEGFGLSIAEARVLGIPVVTTEFDAVWQQMVQGKSGLVVHQDPFAVADAVERLLYDKELYDSVVTFLGQQRHNCFDTLEDFYHLL